MELNKIPVIFCFGPTGSGKSQFALELCLKLKNAEIINVDPLQVYKDCIIMTASPEKNDIEKVKHHLYQFLPIEEEMTRSLYLSYACPLIENLIQKNIIPVIVGGSQYYMQGLIYDDSLTSDETEELKNKGKKFETREAFNIFILDCLHGDNKDLIDIHNKLLDSNLSLPSQVFKNIDPAKLKQLLLIIDPAIKDYLKYDNKRIVENSILKMYSEYILASEMKKVGSKFRYQNTLVILNKSDQQFLKQKIRNRIQIMLSSGGLIEIMNIFDKFYNVVNVSGPSPSFTVGVLQSIGYKEFENFYLKIKNNHDQRGKIGTIHSFQDLLELFFGKEGGVEIVEAIERLNTKTNKYASSQTKMLESKFMNMIPKEKIIIMDSSKEKMEERIAKMLSFLAGFKYL